MWHTVLQIRNPSFSLHSYRLRLTSQQRIASGMPQMSLAKIKRLIALVLRSAGAADNEVSEIDGLYSLRRVLPSLAHVAAFNESERLDVGAWTNPGEKAALSMPQLYSDQKLRMQAVHKAELISLAIVALQNTVQSTPDVSPPWDSIAKYWPPRDPKFSLETFVLGARVDRIVDQPARDKAQPAVQSDSDSDDISSLAASDTSSDSDFKSETDIEANPEDEFYKPSFQTLEWSLAAGPKGRLHLGCCPDLHCGRILRSPETGTSLGLALECQRSWSPRCWRALTPDQQEWWKASSSV